MHVHGTSDIIFDSRNPYGSSALTWYDLGYYPIPLKSGGKTPIVRWTEYREYLSREKVEQWVSQYSTANVGLICKEHIAVDVDVKNGKPGETSLSEMIDLGLLVEKSPQILTPSGGRHLYYKSAQGRTVLSHLPGIDLKGAGYVVAPPSVVNGSSYSIIDCDRLDKLKVENLPWSSYLEAILSNYSQSSYERSEQSSPVEDIFQFELLFSQLGIDLQPGEHTYRCPWHEDDSPSLSINRERTVFCCHSCGVEGNLRDLSKNPQNILRASPRGEGYTQARGYTEDYLSKECPHPITLYIQTKEGSTGRVWKKACWEYRCWSCGPLRMEMEGEEWARRFAHKKAFVFYLPLEWEGWQNWLHRANSNKWLWGKLPCDGRCFLVSEAIRGLPLRYLHPFNGPAGSFDHRDLKHLIILALEEYEFAWPKRENITRERKKSGKAFQSKPRMSDHDKFAAPIKDADKGLAILAAYEKQHGRLPRYGSRQWVDLMMKAGIHVPQAIRREAGLDW